MDETLKPCPFCGGSWVITHRPANGSQPYISCKECNASGPLTAGMTEAQWRAAWNTRADTAPTPKSDEVEDVARAISEARTGNALSYRHFVPEALAAIAALDAARGKAEPVAWMYIRKPEEWPPANPVVGLNKWKYDDPARPYWIETPLYAHPPAPDAARGDPVARLIAYIKTIEPDEETAGCPATWADFIQILEGIAEAGEPFNG